MAFSSPLTALKALTLVADDTTVLTWPALVTSTFPVAAHAPASWLLLDPKGQDQSVLLAGAGATRTFTPLIHSGDWWLLAFDLSGSIIYSHRVQLGDSEGWMIFPDWDDASWGWWTKLDAVPPVVGWVPLITARSGKTITIGSQSYTVSTDMDILYQPLSIPIGLNMETEVYRSAISGNDDTSIAWLGATSDATNPAFVAIGHGIAQTTAGTQTGMYFKDASSGNVGGANATVRRQRAAWAFDSNNRSPSSIFQTLTDAGTYFSVTALGHGGLGFHVVRDFALWVGRVTADGSSYTFEVTARLKVS